MSHHHDHEHDHGHDHDHADEPQPTAEEREMYARRDAALRHVRQFGDPVLKSRASDITEFTDDLGEQADMMVALMHDALGVGLAANQVGSLRRILVYQAYLDEDPEVLVNPQITEMSEDTDVLTEGCLSMPGIALDIERSLKISVTAQDLEGNPLELEAEGIEARIIQHEVDHLEGVLIIDRAEPEQRRGALKALREGSTYAPPGSEEEALESEAEAGAVE